LISACNSSTERVSEAFDDGPSSGPSGLTTAFWKRNQRLGRGGAFSSELPEFRPQGIGEG
jgi:hypothetical protein